MKQKVLIIITSVLIFLLLGGVAISYTATKSKVKESLNLGNKYLEEGKYEEAILAFEKAIKVEPKNIEARVGLAKVYIKLGRDSEAEKVLKDAISINAKKPEPYLLLAELYINEGKGGDAISILEKALEATKNEEIKKMLDRLRGQLPPKASIPSGKYESRQTVILAAEGRQGDIYYTLDGTAPTKDSLKYEKPVEINNGKTTLKAIIIFKDGSQSKELSCEYNIGSEQKEPDTTTSNPQNSTDKDYILPFSNARMVTAEDIKGLTPKEIDLARNEIYARRGYKFQKQEYIDYFSKKSWYKPDPNFSEKNFNEFEKKNVEFLVQYSSSSNEEVGKNGSKNALVDLNYDGTKDRIILECNDVRNQFTLKINTASIRGEAEGVEDVFHIYDIDKTDKFKEVAVSESGPSDDYATYFYAYDGSKIIFMGKISGADYCIVADGSGTLATKTRGEILHTWWYTDYYKLDSGHALKNVPQELYTMNTPVTLKKELSLKKSRTDSSISAVLKAGEKATITVTDNKKWCKVVAQNGKEGWFSVTEVNGGEVFDGLCFAD